MLSKIRALVMILAIVMVALIGLFALFSLMARPEPAPVSVVTQSPTATASPPTEPLTESEPVTETLLSSPDSATNQADSSQMIATVNDETISEQSWQRATRLDAVMSRLARQPEPSAEETLDRLVNEIIVLDGSSEVSQPSAEAIEAKLTELLTGWQLSDDALTQALHEADLTRADLQARVGRLLQLSEALNQLSAEQPDLNVWLGQARASAEIGLYAPLAQQQAQREVSHDQPINNEDDNEDSAVEPPLPEPPSDLPIGPYENEIAPDFSVAGLDDAALTLSSFRGKPVLINFWATWCPPCRRELPALQAVYEKYGDQIGFMAVDVKESPTVVASFVQQLGLTFPIGFDETGEVSHTAYQVRGLPTTILVDARGVVAKRHVGPLDEATLDSYLTPLLTPPAQSTDTPATASADRTTDEATDGPPALDFTLTAADGSTVSLSDYHGDKTAVLLFYRGHT